MALYRHKSSNKWTMDFIINGMRIRESTGMTSKTRAKEVEHKRKQGLKDGIAGIKKRKQPGLLSIAAQEYLVKKKGTKNTLRIERTNLDHLLPELGRKLVTDIEAGTWPGTSKSVLTLARLRRLSIWRSEPCGKS
jgi:hypothetical protein